MSEKTGVKTMTGGQAIAEMLNRYEIGPMVGMGGFQMLPMYEAIRERGMRHYHINDERAAAFAMDAFAKVTNRPGICDATLGPGATNLITGLVESLNAGTPLLCIVGDTNLDHSGKNMTQESRQVEILRPASKEIIRVERIHRIPELVRRAFSVATSGRPGPVVLDVPEDICYSEFGFDENDFWAEEETKKAVSRRCRPDEKDVERAAEILIKARRPVLIVGGGIHISEAYEQLIYFAESNSIPVCHTISGKGSIPCLHPLSGGVVGRFARISDDLIKSSDLLIVAGCKLGELATKRYQSIPSNVPIVHIDIVSEEFGRSTRTDISLFGDVQLGLKDLAAAVENHASRSRTERAEYIAEIPKRMEAWRKSAASKLNSMDQPINIARIFTELNKVMPKDSVLVVDGGLPQCGAGFFTTRSVQAAPSSGDVAFPL